MTRKLNKGEKLKTLRGDSWVSSISGLGGTTDKSQSISFRARAPLTYYDHDAMYTDMWLARRVVNKLPAIAMVRGFTVPDVDDEEELLREFNELNTSKYKSGAFQRWIRYGRLYGGAGLYLGYKDAGAAKTPAPEKGEIQFLDVVPRHMLTVHKRYKGVNHPQVGMPEFYEITGDHPRNGLYIHESRLLRTGGLDAPDTFLEHQREPEWNMSCLQPVIEDLQRYGVSWQAVTHMLQEASIGVLKMSGLIDAIASEDQQEIEDRIDVLNMSKSVTSLLMLDADMNESFERVKVSFGDLPQLMQQLMIGTAGAAEMPVTVLFGQAPSGLNATGESDMRQFYDTVSEYQKRELQPALRLILSRMRGSDVNPVFPPIWEPAAKDVALARQADSAADTAYFTAGVFEPEEIAAARAQGLAPEEIVDADQRIKDLSERKKREKEEGIEANKEENTEPTDANDPGPEGPRSSDQ